MLCFWVRYGMVYYQIVILDNSGIVYLVAIKGMNRLSGTGSVKQQRQQQRQVLIDLYVMLPMTLQNRRQIHSLNLPLTLPLPLDARSIHSLNLCELKSKSFSAFSCTSTNTIVTLNSPPYHALQRLNLFN